MDGTKGTGGQEMMVLLGCMFQSRPALGWDKREVSESKFSNTLAVVVCPCGWYRYEEGEREGGVGVVAFGVENRREEREERSREERRLGRRQILSPPIKLICMDWILLQFISLGLLVAGP